MVIRRLWLILAYFAVWAGPARAQLELRFLNVGQGDAAVITEGGKTALIDAGSSGDVALQLHALGIGAIDLVVASHNHADHIGGMTAVLAGTVVRFYLDNHVRHTTATYQRTIQALTASGAQYLRLTARIITVGDARLRILPPAPGAADQNNASVGVLVEYGEFRALFTGDSESPELEYWLAYDSIPRVQVVKVAHHGSANGTTAAWVAATHPQAAVISVGQNSYGHPSPFVIRQWESAGATVYRTDRNGTLLFVANMDGSFVVTADRIDAPYAMPRPQYVAPVPPDAGDSVPRACCRVCTRGKACGNQCINRDYQCHQPPGCACDGRP